MRIVPLFAAFCGLTASTITLHAQNPTPTAQRQALLDSVYASSLAAFPKDVPIDAALNDQKNCRSEVMQNKSAQRLVLHVGCQVQDSIGFRLLWSLYDVRAGHQPALLLVVAMSGRGQTPAACKIWFNKGMYYGQKPTGEFESRDYLAECAAKKAPPELGIMVGKLAKSP